MELFNPNKCPRCGYKVTVRIVRHISTHTTRRKECLSCKYRFTTAEVNHELTKILNHKGGIEYFDAVLKLKKVRTLLNKKDTSMIDIESVFTSNIKTPPELKLKNTEEQKTKVKKLPSIDPSKAKAHKKMEKFLADMYKKRGTK